MSERTLPFVIAALATLLPLAAEAAKGCKNDIDCSGDQVCQKRRCVDPSRSAKRCVNDLGCDGDKMCEGGRCVAPSKTAKRCASDVACPGNEICQEGRCVAPSGPAIMPHGARVAPAEEPDETPPHPMPPEEPAPAPAPAPASAAEPSQPSAPATGFNQVQPAPAPAAPPPTGDRPTEKAKPGIITGMVFDIIGFGLFLGGGLVLGVDANLLGVGLALGYAGGAFMSIGSTISTVSFTVRHKAYVDAGFDPPGGRRVAAWVLTSFTIGCFAGGLGMGAASGGSLGLAIGSISLNGTAVILEVINYLVRSKCDLQLRESSALRNMTISPIITATRDPLTGDRSPVFGFAGSF